MKVFDGAKMRALRKDAGLTQYYLDPMVGISQMQQLQSLLK